MDTLFKQQSRRRAENILRFSAQTETHNIQPETQLSKRYNHTTKFHKSFFPFSIFHINHCNHTILFIEYSACYFFVSFLAICHFCIVLYILVYYNLLLFIVIYCFGKQTFLNLDI